MIEKEKQRPPDGLLHELDEPSLSKLVKDEEAGKLEGKIKTHA